jgi:PKHD-type hydroxylase
LSALEAHDVFQAIVLPQRIAPPLLSRTVAGGAYGRHVDDAVMGEAPPLRTDVSVTVFLSDLSSYDGGELIVESLSGEDGAKFAAGDAVVYPSTFLHRVAEVTRGERLVAVTWVQSRVRDAGRREMLFDLDRARRQIFERDGKCEAFDLVAKTYANLLRAWAEL